MDDGVLAGGRGLGASEGAEVVGTADEAEACRGGKWVGLRKPGEEGWGRGPRLRRKALPRRGQVLESKGERRVRRRRRRRRCRKGVEG